MGSEVCVGVSGGSATSHEWKKGWPLPYGGFAQYCNNCGISAECKLDTLESISAHEASIFCGKFHREETGWRDCGFCNKPIHSGCIVSRCLFDYLDFGGIGCISCIKASRSHLKPKEPNGVVTSIMTNASDCHPHHTDGKLLVDSVDEGNLLHLCRIVEASEINGWHQPQRDKMISSSGLKSQDIKCLTRDMDSGFSNMIATSTHSLKFPLLENNRPTWEIKNMREPLAQPSLSMSLGIPSGNSALASAGEILEERLEGKPSSLFNQGQRSHPVFTKPSKTGLTMNIERNKGMNSISQARVGRPPVEGRGKGQLLPRYWPRTTDEELQQLSGNLKCTVVPLFEKVLSASDAGRIGRLVLPKACAESFFPPICQPEGLPLDIQDVKGNEWTFQFRYWPNNNSRMYVLEGVTPCIQSMQLIAGDTVTFSRLNPGGKLFIGFRKTAICLEPQDASTSGHFNGITTRETATSGANKNLPSGSGYSDPLQSMEGSGESHLNRQSEHLHLGGRVADFTQTENYGQTTKNDSLQTISVSEKKRTRNIGPKSKRLLINCEDALELRLTWEEAQELLRPPPSVEPIIVTIEDHIFEEYNEPPVFGKRTIFSACPSGGQEQWASCDDCSKWRKLPVDVLLPAKWTCSKNVWDPTRSSCSSPEELGPKEMEDLLKSCKDFKKPRLTENNNSFQEFEPSGLDALANVAVLGDSLGDPCESAAGQTTKHPRHRPGCTCIVCIQPPSGRGRHHSTCTCNVCSTVKRRFNTLMMRKKKRQSECQADANRMDHREDSDVKEAPREDTSHVEKEVSIKRRKLEVGESSSVQIDLNSHPDHEDMQVDAPSMNGHAGAPNHPPLQVYMDQNGPNGGQGCFTNGGSFGPVIWEKERTEDKGL